MTTTATEPSRHPILGCVGAVHGELDKVSTVEPMFMAPAAKRAALVEVHRARQRLHALELRILVASEDVADADGARDAGAWLTHQTREDRGSGVADLALGQGLEQSWTRLAEGYAAGAVNTAQARVIAHSLEELPSDLEPETVVRAEEHLVSLCADHDPKELRVLGRKILEVVAPDLAEDHDAKVLEAEERRARETTTLTMKRCGDGCTRLYAKLPEAVAARLRTYLDAYTSPRHDNVIGVQDGDDIPADRKRGQAFCALLESLDPKRVPLHGGDATTVIVTIGLDDLQQKLASAGLVGEGPITASEARRLACTAQIIPAVLGGKPEILDLGRARRLFSPPQRKAMSIRDRHCRAEAARSPRRGVRRIIFGRGARAARPMWPTGCCSATGTTTAPTTLRTARSSCPLVIGGSTAGREAPSDDS